MANAQNGEPHLGSPNSSAKSLSSNISVQHCEQKPKTETTTSASLGIKITCDKQSSASFKSDEQSVIRKRSESRESVNDDPKSIDDSISAISGKNNWSSIRDIAEYDPSINSIKGDSVSATIADYNRKHNRATAILDNQSRTSCRLDSDPCSATKNDDSSVNINYYAVSGSSAAAPGTSSRQGSGVYRDSHTHNQAVCVRNKKRNNHKHNRRHSTASSRQSSALEQAIQSYDVPQGSVYQIEPIVIRGIRNVSLLGITSSFENKFPHALIGRVSREEFERTMDQINNILREHQSMSAKYLLLGCLFCCCSLGFSIVWPSIVLRRRSKCHLEKFLANENQRLYSKLGISWRLGRRCYSRFVEHVLVIEFNPKIDPFVPD